MKTTEYGGAAKGDAIPQIKRFLSEVKQGVTPQTFWPYEEVGHTQEAKKEILVLFGSDVFITPKPERLLQRIGTGKGHAVVGSDRPRQAEFLENAFEHGESIGLLGGVKRSPRSPLRKGISSQTVIEAAC
jgi:hypothetical protein